jgi:eukaryotic-like serine/threonine-protein kinase
MCPTLEELRRYLGTKMDEAEALAIEVHLEENCPRCNDVMKALEDARGGDDSNGQIIRDALIRRGQGAAVEWPGSVVGRYKLLEVIGEGGMGVVYLAEQSEPVRRRVALKVIKEGMDSKQVVARFEAERQALALMDHPNIAKVHDAGATESGRPYFVMELVKGTPINRYCDERRLTPHERLRLFIPVCRAVQHAHQKGIIHRDIKPSNVLVGPYDGVPVPKVIDFGIAKATGQSLTEKTLFTALGAVAGTPAYMSPEQAELNNLDIDTRCDVYSLGVLLYELLTGTTPLEPKRMKEAALLEILRLVREEEPPRPSTRLSTTDQLPSIAAARGVEPKKLSSLLRGDLDWVVMKALEKPRARRYETADALARDVECYLNGDMVHARPPSAWYRLQKFARKHRAALATAALAAVLLVAGAAVSAWQADRAMKAESKTSRALDELRTEQRKTSAALAAEQASKARAQASERKAKANADLAQVKEGEARESAAVAQASEREAKGQAARARAEEQRANLAQKEAERLHAEAIKSLHETKLLTSRLALDRGLALCERDEVQRGLLWLARSLELAPANEAGLRRSILMILDGWRRQIVPLRACFFGGSSLIGGALLSPDGKSVLISDGRSVFMNEGPTAQLWDINGRPIGARIRTAPQGLFSAAAFSPDGKVVLTGSEIFPDGRAPDRVDQQGAGEARLWDVATGKPIGAPMTHKGRIEVVAFRPDGRACLTGSGDQTARLWDATTGKPLSAPMVHLGRVLVAAFSPDGKMVLTGGGDFSIGPGKSRTGAAQLWDAATGKPLAAPMVHRGVVRALAFSPTGKSVLTGSDGPNVDPFALAVSVSKYGSGEAWLWDVATGRPIGGPMTHLNSVEAVAFSPDGRVCLTGGADGEARPWDAATGKPLGLPMIHRLPIRAVGFNRDGKTILTTSGQSEGAEVQLWEAATSKPIATSRYEPGYGNTTFSPDGRMVLTTGKVARLWDVAAVPTRSPLIAYRQPIGAMALSPDGKTILTATGGPYGDPGSPLATPGQGTMEARLWDAATGGPLAPPMTHKGAIMTAVFSPDGRVCLTGGTDGEARLWDAATGKPLGAPMIHRGPIHAVAFSPDGKIILTGGRDPGLQSHVVGGVSGQARLWDAATGKLLSQPIMHQGGVLKTAFSPDGKRFLTGLAFETHLWDMATGRRIGDPIRFEGQVGGNAFSPDGKTVLIAVATTVRLWDAETAKPLIPPIPHRTVVNVAVFSPDGKRFLTGTGLVSMEPDQTTECEARLWDAATGKPLTPPMTHKGAVMTAAFSPDGRVCLTGGAAGEARLWDAATGKPLGAPMAQGGHVFAAAFSPDGRACLTATWNGIVRRWPAPLLPVDDAERITLWIQLMTDLKFDSYNTNVYLNYEDRKKKMQRLENLGGSPFDP